VVLESKALCLPLYSFVLLLLLFCRWTFITYEIVTIEYL
jgi:hypothetical protein